MSRLFAWTLNVAYLAVMLIVSPWILWAAWKNGKYREGFAEKLWGQVPERRGDCPCVWLHAVSVGEVNLLETTLSELAIRRPDWELVISTTTKAGYDLAREKYTEHTVFYCPLDFSWATQRAIRRVRPDLLVLAELELWPNLIQAAKQQGVRVAIINGRLSDKSFRGYSRLEPLVSRVLAKLDLIAAQNQETADRFRRLGARSAAIHSTGSLKFDGATTDRNNFRTRQLRELAGIAAGDVVFLAGSTQAPEEEMALRIYRELAADSPHLKLVLVPRHPQRFDEVAQLLHQSGLDWTRRSELIHSALRTPQSSWWIPSANSVPGGARQRLVSSAAVSVAGAGRTCWSPPLTVWRLVLGRTLGISATLSGSCSACKVRRSCVMKQNSLISCIAHLPNRSGRKNLASGLGNWCSPNRGPRRARWNCCCRSWVKVPRNLVPRSDPGSAIPGL